MSPKRSLICMVSASFVPNLAPLPFLALLQQKVALLRWTNNGGLKTNVANVMLTASKASRRLRLLSLIIQSAVNIPENQKKTRCLMERNIQIKPLIFNEPS